MRVIDTSAEMLSAFSGDCFDIEKWKKYIDSCVPGAKDICLSDMNECINAGFIWEKDYLPVLNMVPKNKVSLNGQNGVRKISKELRIHFRVI